MQYVNVKALGCHHNWAVLYLNVLFKSVQCNMSIYYLKRYGAIYKCKSATVQYINILYKSTTVQYLNVLSKSATVQYVNILFEALWCNMSIYYLKHYGAICKSV